MEQIKGTVCKATGSWYSVFLSEGQIIQARVRGKIRLQGSRSTNPVVVGDWVSIEEDKRNGDYFIVDINERKNHIIRRSTNLSYDTHVIAANIDQAVLIVTLSNPHTSLAFIDRYLVTCEAYHILGIIVFNKVDLYNEDLNELLNEYFTIYQAIGYQCLSVSAKTGFNLDAFQHLLQGKISLLSGHSGVGKSTLINAIEPHFQLKTQEISDYHHKGKHTTTFSEMFPLSHGGFIIDSPGIKGFGLVKLEKNELHHYFPEIFKLSGKCQYYNCTHNHEPGCVIKQAIENGEVNQSRYLNYLSLLLDEDDRHRQ